MEHEDSHEDYILCCAFWKKYGRAVAGGIEPLLKYRLSSKGKSGSSSVGAMTYRGGIVIVGMSRWRSLVCFCMYAVNGVWKYARAYFHLARFWCLCYYKNKTKRRKPMIQKLIANIKKTNAPIVVGLDPMLSYSGTGKGSCI